MGARYSLARMAVPTPDRRSAPRLGIVVRVGLVLTATGVASAALERRALAGTPPDVALGLGFGIFAVLILLATFWRLARGAEWLAITLAATVYLGAALALGGGRVGMAAFVAAAILVMSRTARHLRPFAVAAFALWTPALIVFGPPGMPAVPIALLVASMATVAYTAAVLVDPSTVHPSLRLRRVGYGILAIATTATAVDRHITVASSGVAPDDLLAIVSAVALPALAHVRMRSSVRSACATGVALATFVLTGMALILGAPYHSDAVVAPHRAAEILISGSDPYRSFDLVEALSRFGLSPELVTNFENGEALHAYNYPALSFLVVAPLVAGGLPDIRWVYLAELFLIALLVTRNLRVSWRPMGLASIVGNGVIVRQHVLAGIDPTWALLVLGGWLALQRRWWSPVFVGLAVASRQTAWFVTPFYVIVVWRRWGRGEALRRALVASVVALAVNVPFLVDAPAQFISGVTLPLLAPLEPDGVGVVRFGMDGVVPLFPRAVYGALALAAFTALVVLFIRWPRALRSAPLVWPFLPLYLAWRSLQNYFAFLPVFALVADDELTADGATSPD